MTQVINIKATVKELKNEAKNLGIKGYSKMRKAELIAAIDSYKVAVSTENIYNSYQNVAYDPIKDYEQSGSVDTWDDEVLSMPNLEDQPADSKQEVPVTTEPEATMQEVRKPKSFKQGYGKHGVIITLPEPDYFDSHNKCEDVIKALARVTHNGKALWYKGRMYNNQFIANAVNLQDAMMLVIHNTSGMKDDWNSVEKLMGFLVKKGWLTIVNKKKTYRYSTIALTQKSLDLLKVKQ